MSADASVQNADESVKSKPRPKATNGKSKPLPMCHVVLHDDNDHTHEYVIEMLKALFAHPAEMGLTLAKQVDEEGKAIVLTTHRERAELKRDQIHAFGADHRVATSQGSMSASIVPAE